MADYSYYPRLDHLHALIVGGQQYNAHTDAVGNVIALTDAAQTVQRTYEYDAWGQLTGGSDTKPFNNADRARWKGALWLGPEVADLYYMRNRWYESRSGRFLSEDPVGLTAVGAAPQGRFVCNCTNLRANLVQLGTGDTAEYPYYPGVGGPQSPVVGGGQPVLHANGLGNIVALPDNAKAVERAYGFGGWNQLKGWTDLGPFAFADRPKAQDVRGVAPVVDLSSNPAQPYERNPARQQFVSGGTGLISGMNAYLYGANDPVNIADPTGLKSLLFYICVAGWTGVGALAGYIWGGPAGAILGGMAGFDFGTSHC